MVLQGFSNSFRGRSTMPLLAFAALLVAVALSLQLFRWFILVHSLDLPCTLRNTFRLGMVGVFYNTFLPGSVGGDLLKAYFIAKEHPERKTRAVATVIADRALGLFGLILFCAVLGSLAWAGGDPRIAANPELQKIVLTTAAIAAGTIIGFVLLGFLPQRRVDRFAVRLKWVPKVGRSLAELWFAVWMYRQRIARSSSVSDYPRWRTSDSSLLSMPLRECFHRRIPPSIRPRSRSTWSSRRSASSPRRCPSLPVALALGKRCSRGSTSSRVAPRAAASLPGWPCAWCEWIIGLIGYLVYLRMKKELPIEVEEENGEAASADSTRTALNVPHPT